MRALFKNGSFVEDEWRTVTADEALPTDRPVILPLARWRAERMALSDRNTAVGVSISPGEAIDDVVQELAQLPLVALVFPRYTDGRAYSTANLLRTRHGFAGELRAVGDVLLDQIQLMRRCGFDSFEISHAPTISALRAGHVAGVTHFYQPSLDANEAPAGTRPWLRSGTRA
jgi:uncharacterized protein (DUF934 family)